MFCKVCGKEVNDKAIICPACGCKISESEEILATATTADKGKKKINVCCLVGFILALASFFLALYGIVAIAGLVLSIIGLVQCSKGNYSLKGLGIAGVIVAACGIIYAVYSIIAAAYLLSLIY